MKKKFQIKNIKKGGSRFSNYQQYGFLCIKSLNHGILTVNQLESIRRCILRKLKRKCIIWIRAECVYPITKKSAGSRMGKGVGPIKNYIMNVKSGRILLELQATVSKELISLLKRVLSNLPIRACILLRSYY